jgi:hypothetical protein
MSPTNADSRKLALIATAAYLIVVSFLAFHHEVWRDEVRALNIAAASHSPVDLLRNLKNEGHPALWYLLLYLGNHITGSMLVLKPTALLIAAAAAYVLMRFAPFPAWQKVLFLLGQFPLYEYSVMCRNYGISMLLLFAAATVYRCRFTHPWRLAVLLALLANTNAHCLILVTGWLVLWLGEWAVRWRTVEARARTMLPALSLVLVAMVVCVWVVYPDHRSIVTGVRGVTWQQVRAAFLGAVVSPGRIYAEAMGLGSEFALGALFWLFALSFLARPWQSAAVVVVGLGLTMFASLVYGFGLRHGGLFLMFGVAVLWISRDGSKPVELFSPVARLVRIIERHRAAAFSIFLILQAALAVPQIALDLRGTVTGTPALAKLLRTNPDLSRAIVIAEPEPMIEGLPYYSDNPVYLAREGRFMLKVHFTTENRAGITLDAIQAAGEDLQRTTGRPVVFALGHTLDRGGPFERPTPFGKMFRYSPASLQHFLDRTEHVADSRGDSGDENFFVYKLR